MRWLKKKSSGESTEEVVKNWYADRYQTVVVQRNFLVVLLLALLVGVIVSVMAVINVTSSKSIEPFVIEIEKKTGITNVIRPLLKEQFAYDDALRRYFLMKYITARETYDYYTYNHNYNKVVRLLSDGEVYSEFRREISLNNPSSPITLGTRGKREIQVKSITPLENADVLTGFTAQIRFSSKDVVAQSHGTVRHLVATITFSFEDLVLSTEERNINPLGFQVIGYRTDEEIL